MKELLIGGALALGMLAPTVAQDDKQVSPPATQQTPQQQQIIPDAPRPQTPGLGPVAPGKGTTPTSNGDAGTPAAATADPDAPPSSLPSAADQQQAERLADDGAAPDLPASGQGPAYTLKARVNFVDVPFTVKDKKGNLVPGLTWRDVRVYDNNLRQKMAVFTVDPFPLSVALVIDQSMDFHTMDRVNASLGALQGAFTPYDEVSVFTYNHSVSRKTDFTGGQSARLGAVIDQSKSVGSEVPYYAPGEGLGGGININNGAEKNMTPLGAGLGHTGGVDPQVERESHPLNDAILEAAKATTRAGKDRRRVVYVISDGKEFGSVTKSKDLIKYLQRNNITVYATLVGDSSVEGLGFLNSVHLPLTVRDNILPVYTRATGGETYAEFRTKAISESFQRIAEEVRTQYTVGYYSNDANPLDAKFHAIELRIMRPGLTVIAKKGYYPAAVAVPPPAVQRVATP